MAYLFIAALVALLVALYLRQQALQQRVRRFEGRLDSLAYGTGHAEYKTDYIDEKLQNKLKPLKRDGQMPAGADRTGSGAGKAGCRPALNSIHTYVRLGA